MRIVAEKYALGRQLGVGGMGTVYEATHLVTGQRVALKVVRPEVASLPGFAERFVREAQAASHIGHPALVAVLDAGVDAADGALYLALELLDGEELAAALARGALDADRLLRIALDLCRALDAAHARGVVHRDLKPENVFLTRDGRTKLLDFGIAKHLHAEESERLTRTGVVLGTPRYMSPEQAQSASIDARSDVWSLGAILYDALTGRPPYVGTTLGQLITSLLTEPVAPLVHIRPELPGALVALVDRALHRDPGARWQSMRALGEAILVLLSPKSPAGSLAHITLPRR